MSRLAPPQTRLLLAADRRAEEQARALGTELRRLREDSGLALRAVARAARIAPAHLVDIELSRCDASRKALARVAAVLGADISERIFPNTGPLIRDRLQTPILDALLAIVDPRWARHLEVPITGRVRGVIDLVLVDAVPALLVAGEIESGIRRLEQQIRWAHEKADAIGEQAAKLGIRGPARVSRLMVVRSTAHTREIARAHAKTLRAEFPARTVDAVASLTGSKPWPGPTILWATVEAGRATILDRPPRGVDAGR